MTTEPPADDLIRYDVMVQDALISVVRKVLQDAARRGLPGEHHFYITFRTHAPGARVSARLRERHPDEMTIVLQHQFWDLQVGEHGFEVGLSFGGIAERLVVPFEAMTGFFDPSVQFGLKFAADEATAANDGPEDDGLSVKEKLEAITEHEKAGKKKRKTKSPDAAPGVAAADTSVDGIAALPARAEPKSGEIGASPAATAEARPAGDAAGAEVVSLDAFRKKK
jgi:hypothetical protein